MNNCDDYKRLQKHLETWSLAIALRHSVREVLTHDLPFRPPRSVVESNSDTKLVLSGNP